MVCMQRMRGRGLCALAAAWIAVTVPVRGDILLVHHDPPATGFWSEAETTLDAALAIAEPGDQIWIAGGTYVPGGLSPTRTSTFVIAVDGELEIAGNFAGTEEEIDQRDHINPAHETILSGLIGSDPNDWNDRVFHVITADPETPSALSFRLDALTVARGWATGESSLSFPNAVEDPWGDSLGGAGGGLLSMTGDFRITLCTFRDNRAGHPSCPEEAWYASMSGAGAAIFATWTWESSTGGEYEVEPDDDAYPTEIVASSFIRNHADGGKAIGANPAGSGGAIAFSNMSPTVRIVNSVFFENSMFAHECDGTVRAAGGALATSGGSGWLTIVSSTFVDNTAESTSGDPLDAAGGAIERCAPTRIRNTILWGNTANGVLSHVSAMPFGTGCTAAGTIIYKHCNVELPSGTQSGTGNINADPLFVDREAGDLRLTEESPCIDAGWHEHLVKDHYDINRDGNLLEDAPDRDLANRTFGCPPDMGAFEFIPEEMPLGDLDGNGRVDFQDLLLVLSCWSNPEDPPLDPSDPCAPSDLSENGSVDFWDVLLILAWWTSCDGEQVTQGSVSECIDKLGFTNPAALGACIEAMIINGTP